MTTITATGTALTELVLRDSSRRSNVLSTLPYVPGAAIRGHLAARWLTRGGDVDTTFRRIFESGEVRFRHAYPCVDGAPTIPAPLTLRRCKTASGPGHLAGDTSTSDGPPVCDHRDHASASPDGIARGATRRVRGLVTRDGNELASRDLTVVRSRVGTLDDATGSGRVAEGALFTERRLRAGTEFQIVIEGERTHLERLLTLVDTDGDLITVGRARSVTGTVVLSSIELTDQPELIAVREGVEHTLTFLSDTIILDEFQRSVVDLSDPATLTTILGVNPGSVAGRVEPVTAHVRTTEVGGWDQIDGTPKPVDVAIAAGSVVRFRTDAREAVERLAAEPWVGWRRAEGFGQLEVDHPLHLPGARLRGPAAGASTTQVDADRDRMARRAQEVAVEIRHVTRSTWQGIEDTVRRNEAPRPSAEVETEQHAQSRSGRGARAGALQRERRDHAITTYLAACDELDIDVPSRRAVTFADDIGREHDLLGARR